MYQVLCLIPLVLFLGFLVSDWQGLGLELVSITR